MTKDQLVNYVCLKLGQTDTDTVAAANIFMESRANMIWDAQPWRDSLTVCAVQLPNLPLWQSCPWVILPAQIGKVMKVRFDPSITMESNEPVTWFDINPAEFEQTGTPCKFLQYPPVVAQITATGTNTVGTDETVNISSTDARDIAALYDIEVETSSGAIIKSTGQVLSNTTSPPYSASFILSFNKPVTFGGVYFTSSPPAGTLIPPVVIDTNFSTIVPQMGPNDTFAPRVQRIRLSPVPTGAGSILVLGKRVFPGFASGQEFALQNVDNALQDFTLADLLERNRQYGKATQQAQAANTQLQIAFDLETKQAANERRIIPANIGGQDMLYGGFTSKGYW